MDPFLENLFLLILVIFMGLNLYAIRQVLLMYSMIEKLIKKKGLAKKHERKRRKYTS
jgi:hypothetical protein